MLAPEARFQLRAQGGMLRPASARRLPWRGVSGRRSPWRARPKSAGRQMARGPAAWRGECGRIRLCVPAIAAAGAKLRSCGFGRLPVTRSAGRMRSSWAGSCAASGCCGPRADLPPRRAGGGSSLRRRGPSASRRTGADATGRVLEPGQARHVCRGNGRLTTAKAVPPASAARCP